MHHPTDNNVIFVHNYIIRNYFIIQFIKFIIIMRVFAKSFLAVVAAVFFLTSCGGGSPVCGCVDTTVAMLKEAKGLNFDQEKMKSLEEKYKGKMDKCEKLGEGKSDDDKKKMEEEMKACGSYKEIEALTKEMMESMMKGLGDEMKDNMEAPSEEPSEEPTEEEKPADDHSGDNH